MQPSTTESPAYSAQEAGRGSLGPQLAMAAAQRLQGPMQAGPPGFLWATQSHRGLQLLAVSALAAEQEV